MDSVFNVFIFNLFVEVISVKLDCVILLISVVVFVKCLVLCDSVL